MSYINLLPEDYLARQAQKRANLLCAVLFGLVMAGVLTATLVSARSQKRTCQVSERVNEAYADANKLIRQLQELEGVRQRLVKKADMTAELLERVPRSYLLATVTNALPAGGSLTCFKLSSKRDNTTVIRKASSTRYDAAAARKKVQTSTRMDVALTVTGLAGTDVEVARFIAQMARCPLMETVDLVYSEEKKVQDVMVREFQVVMRLKGEADVRGAFGRDVALDRRPQAEATGEMR